MTKYNLITNTDNGAGLEQDARLLKGLLEGWGHSANLVHYMRIDAGVESADVNIFLEVIPSAMFPKAKQQWLIPNQEWFAPWDNDPIMPKIDKILCKTQDAVRIFSENYGAERVRFIGFESKDLYDPSIPRQRKFLHVAGQSRYKNSQAVSYCFAKFMDDSDPDIRRDLVFIGAYPEEAFFARDHKNVTYIQRASDAEMKRLMNECLFHIIPSGAEGFGHVIHEGLGCGAVVITTDFPPMNEYEGTAKELLIPIQRAQKELSAMRAFVGALEVKTFIEKAWKLPQSRLDEIGAAARIAFLAQRDRFRIEFKKVVDGQ